MHAFISQEPMASGQPESNGPAPLVPDNANLSSGEISQPHDQAVKQAPAASEGEPVTKQGEPEAASASEKPSSQSDDPLASIEEPLPMNSASSASTRHGGSVYDILVQVPPSQCLAHQPLVHCEQGLDCSLTMHAVT